MTTKPNFKQKTIIVIGGAGFIGSHLCAKLVKNNFVICVDDLSGGSEKNIDHLLSLPNFSFIKHNLNKELNLEDRVELKELDLKFQGIQEIYHLAALMSPKKFNDTKLEIINNNINVTQNALKLAVKYNGKLLFSSSSVVYGNRPDNKTFFQEDYFGYVDPIGKRCCYDEGKRCAESIVSVYKEKYKLDIKIARIFRTYGTKMSLNDGHMIPDFVLNALNGKDLVIYGNNNFRTSLCYVTDIIDGIIEFMNLEKDVGPVNFGSDQDYKLEDIANKIIEIAKQISPSAEKSKIVYEDALEFMIPLGLPSIAKAKEHLRWLPIVTLDTGLKSMIDYVMANKNAMDFRLEI
ncbi:NAD-dependent epimerase/dehydratase family protein [Patescibacteria group bacterium]